jgi:sugar/nucleoside kinase (ribokinase family)
MSKEELNFNPDLLKYSGIIGTGGIGSGKFFVINGDQTLGREESRSGHFLNMRDYCKQHIILHYIKVLLGPSFSVIPIGKIGDDDIGQILFSEMARTGFIMKRIEVVKNVSTLYSFCFAYPDGSGGNLTTDNSASVQVDEDFIAKAVADIENLGTRGIIMAAPEVPLKARQKLLELGKQNGLFCAASFTTEEMRNACESGMITSVDLGAINLEEASAIAGSSINSKDNVPVIEAAIRRLRMSNEKIMVSVTCGMQGSWCWDSNELSWFPAVKTTAISTAGAGDAFFAGILSGIAIGLSLKEAQQLATLVAGMSVTSPHTIHDGINRHSLFEFLKKSDLDFSEIIYKILED